MFGVSKYEHLLEAKYQIIITDFLSFQLWTSYLPLTVTSSLGSLDFNRFETCIPMISQNYRSCHHHSTQLCHSMKTVTIHVRIHSGTIFVTEGRTWYFGLKGRKNSNGYTLLFQFQAGISSSSYVVLQIWNVDWPVVLSLVWNGESTFTILCSH